MRSSQHRDPGLGSSGGNQGQNGQAAQQGQEKLGLGRRTPTPSTGLISPSMKPRTKDKGSEDNLSTTVLCHPKGHCDKREVGRGLSRHISQVRKQVQRGKLICMRPHSK